MKFSILGDDTWDTPEVAAAALDTYMYVACASIFPEDRNELAMDFVSNFQDWLNADPARIADYAAGVFARLRAAGAATMVFGSGWARAVPDGWPRERADEQFTSLLASLGPLAEAEGVSLVLEPLARVECNFLNTPEEGARFARESGSAAVGVLADSFHWLRNGEGPETIAAARDRFRHAHVSTVPGRLMPGREPCDLGPFFGALAAIGYDGRVTVEAKAEPPEGRAEKLRLALAAMRGWEAR